ncbi:MAG: flagellar basal body rod protein [Myxococcota bacterium]
MDPLSTAASGMRSAEIRLAASAHNVASLTTPSFRPLRVVQASLKGGGSVACAHQEPVAREVDLTRKFVDQTLASVQFKASLRVLSVSSETRGQLVDLLA